MKLRGRINDQKHSVYFKCNSPILGSEAWHRLTKEIHGGSCGKSCTPCLASIGLYELAHKWTCNQLLDKYVWLSVDARHTDNTRELLRTVNNCYYLGLGSSCFSYSRYCKGYRRFHLLDVSTGSLRVFGLCDVQRHVHLLRDPKR